jgi:hypothetical protein
MEKHFYLFLVLAILLVGSVVVGTIAVNDYYRQHAPTSCDEFIMRNSFIWLPEKVSDVFYGKKVILHFSMINGNNITVNGVVSESEITDLHCGRSADYDYEIWMSDLNALELATSTKPVTTFVRLWRSGQIKIKPNGSENELLLSKADLLLSQDDEPVPEWIRNIFGRYLE